MALFLVLRKGMRIALIIVSVVLQTWSEGQGEESGVKWGISTDHADLRGFSFPMLF